MRHIAMWESFCFHACTSLIRIFTCADAGAVKQGAFLHANTSDICYIIANQCYSVSRDEETFKTAY